LIGVNVVGHEAEKLKEVMTKENMNWRSLSSRDISAKWNAATPTYYVIDHHGIIRNKWVGSPGEKAIDAALEKLIQQAEGNPNKVPK
jgi:peroxiredoxin